MLLLASGICAQNLNEFPVEFSTSEIKRLVILEADPQTSKNSDTVQILEFNERGARILETTSQSNGVKKTTHLHYQSNGLLKKQSVFLTWPDGANKPFANTIYSYHPNTQKSSTITTSYARGPDAIDATFFDTYGFPIKQLSQNVMIDSSGTRYKRQYDAQGRPILTQSFSLKGKWLYAEKRIYAGQTTVLLKANAPGDFHLSDSLIYNGAAQLIVHNSYSGGKLKTQVLNTYEEKFLVERRTHDLREGLTFLETWNYRNGTLIEEQGKYPLDNEQLYHHRYRINSSNAVKCKTRYGPNGRKITKIKIFYDKRGKPVKLLFFKNGKLVKTTYYHITYF